MRGAIFDLDGTLVDSMGLWETAVDRWLIERGEAPLNESMKLFEEGTKLSASLGKLLDKAEQKVTVMQENMQGELAEQPFAAEEEAK